MQGKQVDPVDISPLMSEGSRVSFQSPHTCAYFFLFTSRHVMIFEYLQFFKSFSLLYIVLCAQCVALLLLDKEKIPLLR
ncbi:hypothetical protein QR98_0079120 [Sarcoptes scabiei]|uniref:Uncharacterized protein n=1 Tax=Sarcoptes scabiei TaxID=52283 RepID=A0A132AEG5_SARSC|nr:hypothetical protein QR98_0079120 [Sarcoptes scabiei]